MAKAGGTAGRVTPTAGLPEGVSTAPIPIEEAIRAFSNQNWRDKIKGTMSPITRTMYVRLAAASTAFLRENNGMLVRILEEGQKATKRGASERDIRSFATLAKEASRIMLGMAKESNRTKDEIEGLQILSNRIANLVNPFTSGR